ncbi:MAG: IS66 family insertion sequence element accessory protein TnpB [Rubrivivax sp.]|nr:IS66 family insertion sequence element accessory protein TnpB [Rubrivivax sp.]
MIQITAHMRILVAVEPIDFRAGIDALVGACRKRLQADPFSGALFVFSNRTRTAIKVLVYDGQGFWMCHKRLSSGRFAWWPSGECGERPAAHCRPANSAVSVPNRPHPAMKTVHDSEPNPSASTVNVSGNR